MRGDAWGSYAYLRDYNPYWLPGRAPNPAFRRPADALILDLKDGHENGIEHAREQFLRVSLELGLHQDTLVAIVPGHDAAPTNAARPLARVVARLVNWNGLLQPAVDAVIRHAEIPKLATGGDRAIEVHLASMRVAATVARREVFLIDDVATTGNSLLAARRLLELAGAHRVAAVALARTARPESS
jgi:hypothetical protein